MIYQEDIRIKMALFCFKICVYVFYTWSCEGFVLFFVIYFQKGIGCVVSPLCALQGQHIQLQHCGIFLTGFLLPLQFLICCLFLGHHRRLIRVFVVCGLPSLMQAVGYGSLTAVSFSTTTAYSLPECVWNIYHCVQIFQENKRISFLFEKKKGLYYVTIRRVA